MIRDQYGIDVFTGTLSKVALDQLGSPYSLVHLSHVLEHIKDLKSFMLLIKRASSNNVFVEVPCFDKQNSDGEPFSFFYEHMQYFTLESLQELFHRNGFDTMAIQIRASDDGSFPYFPVIDGLFKKTESTRKYPRFCGFTKAYDLLAGYWDWSTDKLREIKRAIDGISSSEPIAVWGVGGHTAKLIGMTNLLHKNIVLFIDSDSHKQGHTYIGRKIIGYDKQKLENLEIETIVISTREGERSIRETLRMDSWAGCVICFYPDE